MNELTSGSQQTTPLLTDWVEALTADLDQLHKSYYELVERLSPILRPEEPLNSAQGEIGDATSTSELGNQLRMRRQQIQGMNRQLRSLLERLEL